MLEDVIRDRRVRSGVERSGFVPILQEFEAYLCARGYASKTVSFYEQGVVHFALWIARRKLGPPEITNDCYANFLRHLVRCRCRLAGVRERHTVRAALRHFQVVLDGRGHRPQQRETGRNDVHREIQRLDDHLRATCGLREATRTYRRRYVCEFLQKIFGDGPVEPSRLTPQAAIQFVSKRAAALKPGSANVVASSLRSYLRFLQLQGECDAALLLAVPRAAADWKLAPLPKVLTDDHVNSLLGVFDRKSATGRRDYAIMRCLTDLGLRAGEVARLRLDDINWRDGTLRIVGGKSRRDDKLPVPATLGRAIAAYLRRGRPQSSERQVFLRVRPPLGQGVTARTVCNVVLRAAARAELTTVLTGPRTLRHTAATRMLRRGASIKEVADVLRHRCLDTTAIYTKVDRPRLAAVALPWPKDPS